MYGTFIRLYIDIKFIHQNQLFHLPVSHSASQSASNPVEEKKSIFHKTFKLCKWSEMNSREIYDGNDTTTTMTENREMVVYESRMGVRQRQQKKNEEINGNGNDGIQLEWEESMRWMCMSKGGKWHWCLSLTRTNNNKNFIQMVWLNDRCDNFFRFSSPLVLRFVLVTIHCSFAFGNWYENGAATHKPKWKRKTKTHVLYLSFIIIIIIVFMGWCQCHKHKQATEFFAFIFGVYDTHTECIQSKKPRKKWNVNVLYLADWLVGCRYAM